MIEHIIAMAGGPGKLRFLVQPTVAIVLGIVHGLRDHREGEPPYLMGLIAARGDRLRRIRLTLREIAVPLCIAVLVSYTFQYIIRSRINFAYGFWYAAIFVALPYVAARGLANRLAGRPLRRGRPRKPGSGSARRPASVESSGLPGR